MKSCGICLSLSDLVSCFFKWKSINALKFSQIISWELSALVLSQWVQRKSIQKLTQGRTKFWPESEGELTLVSGGWKGSYLEQPGGGADWLTPRLGSASMLSPFEAAE